MQIWGPDPCDRCPRGVQEQIVSGSVVKRQGISSELKHRQWIEKEILLEVFLSDLQLLLHIQSASRISCSRVCDALVNRKEGEGEYDVV